MYLESPQVEAETAISPVIGVHFFLENWDKSSSQHLHLRKSFIEARAKVLRLRHPSSFLSSPYFYLVAWVKIFLSTAPPSVGHQPYQTSPWVPQFQLLVTPYGMPLVCMHPLGPWSWKAFQLSFHCPPPGSTPWTLFCLFVL